MISLYLMGNEAANWTQWNTWEYFLWFENNLNIWIYIMVLHKNKLHSIKAAFNTKWIILSIQRSICLCHKHICSTKMNRNHYLNNTLYKYLPFTSVSYKCEQKNSTNSFLWPKRFEHCFNQHLTLIKTNNFQYIFYKIKMFPEKNQINKKMNTNNLTV